MPQLDDYLKAIAALLSAAVASGWGGVAAVSSTLVAALVIAFHYQKFYKKYIEVENLRRAQKAQAKNPVDNRADELAAAKAEDEIEALLQGGDDAGSVKGRQ